MGERRIHLQTYDLGCFDGWQRNSTGLSNPLEGNILTDMPSVNTPVRLVDADDLITDQALENASADAFHHGAIAEVVADLVVATATPANVALFGPWGSGKSSLYNLMKSQIRLKASRTQVARYDAWKFGGRDLKRNFILSIANDVGLENTRDLNRELMYTQERSRLHLWDWLTSNWRSIALALGIGFGVAAAWVSVHAIAVVTWIGPQTTFGGALKAVVEPEFGLVLAALLTALVIGPKALESAVTRTTRPASERDDEFAHAFSKLIQRVKEERQVDRLVIFIDELDRCPPSDVVATLIDLKTFLDEKDCVFVVAADREVLEHALLDVPQAKPVRDDEPYYSTPGAFIDKIFQHQLALPPLRSHALSSFAHGLVDGRSRGLWNELRSAGDARLFDDVVYILVPAHVQSPRRVKVLLNNFAVNVRVSQARSIEWLSRAKEIAVLTVLQTEFPAVALGLVSFPQLLAHLRSGAVDPALTPEQASLVIQFRDPEAGAAGAATDPDDEEAAIDSVAGAILADGQSGSDTAAVRDEARRRRAGIKLARQLREYLDKLEVVSGLQDPRPDLFYLRVVGFDEGLTNPELGEVIDLAAERAPAAVVAAFADQPEGIRALAVSLLIQASSSERGVGRANVLESACRLTETLDQSHVAKVATLAPEVLKDVGLSSWRRQSVPGALYLASSVVADEKVYESLLSVISTEDEDVTELTDRILQLLPRLSPKTTDFVHALVARLLPARPEPLINALSVLPKPNATSLLTSVSEPVASAFVTLSDADRSDLFTRLTDAVRSRTDQTELAWRITKAAQDADAQILNDLIFHRRELILPLMSRVHQTATALYGVELGKRSDWAAWSDHIHPTRKRRSLSFLSPYFRDAGVVIVGAISEVTEDLRELIDKVLPHVATKDRPSVTEALLNAVPQMPWGEADDSNGLRRQNLEHAASVAKLVPKERARLEASQVDALLGAVQSVASTTSTPDALAKHVREWKSVVSQRDPLAISDVDDQLSGIAASDGAADVAIMRLRIAVRRRRKASPIRVAELLECEGKAGAVAAASEWLRLGPTAQQAVAVHRQIGYGYSALAKYADTLSASQRSDLWSGLIKNDADESELKAAGSSGVDGSAIHFMHSRILRLARQTDRDAEVTRLLTATFAEEPGPSEVGLGHKEATLLARALAEGTHGDVVQAARIILHSNGVARGSATVLKRAFNQLANGKQKRNLSTSQAEGLAKLGLLTPQRKGPFAAVWKLMRGR